MGLFRKGRDSLFHNLFKERLEQLWVFRELVALARTGHTSEATILSFTNESFLKNFRGI